ncbi:YaaC family protein [Streptomyces violens]|uniref:YaaC family protein n=1 Tax=Streptomyces violens TaxID=66377 RepID=UPI0009979CF3|nr:YaaC family protein [Streptomyces violens]
MPLPQPRPFTSWVITTPSTQDVRYWSEKASFPLLLENLRRHAEISTVGRKQFSGTLAQKNKLWLDYRNFMRQALSNFSAALGVENRSACLLYYYSMLNFAKAELLKTHPSNILGRFVGHGLSFGPNRARTTAGDSLIVKDGVFPWLYEKRTGHKIPVGTKLPVKRLLRHVPEIGTQAVDAGFGSDRVIGLHHLIAMDSSAAWPVLLSQEVPKDGSVTARAFHKVFREVAPAFNWRDTFAISRRSMGARLFEAIDTAPHDKDGNPDVRGALHISLRLEDFLQRRHSEYYETALCPSLYDSKMLLMPSSLARYAITYYASSLVRYKPSAFDSQIYPEQALLFDAIARECALPMLIDTLSELEAEDQLFLDGGSLRV